MKNLIKNISFELSQLFKSKEIVYQMAEKRDVMEYYRKLFKPAIFIETGTLMGDTVAHFKDKFDVVYSIELSSELAKKATDRFKGDKNVKIIQGDSGLVLSELLKEIEGTPLFWLDGHYSSSFFINSELIKTAKGTKNTPIVEELNIILQANFDPIILIDDARLFTGKEDYPSFKSIIKIVRKYKPKYEVFIDKDIIQIIPPQ